MRKTRTLCRVLFCIIAVKLVGFAVMWWAGVQFQHQAETFWGKAYQPGVFFSTEVNFPFPDSLLIAEGGPIVAQSIAACPGGTPPLMVPIRIVSDEEFEVLCGLGNDVSIHRRSAENYGPITQDIIRSLGDRGSR